MKMVMNGLDHKIINQQFLGLAQLAENVRKMEQLRAEKERIMKAFKWKKIAYVMTLTKVKFM